MAPPAAVAIAPTLRNFAAFAWTDPPTLPTTADAWSFAVISIPRLNFDAIYLLPLSWLRGLVPRPPLAVLAHELEASLAARAKLFPSAHARCNCTVS